jgi:hypothetical protein
MKRIINMLNSSNNENYFIISLPIPTCPSPSKNAPTPVENSFPLNAPKLYPFPL